MTPISNFKLSQPAHRALAGAKITSIEDLAKWTRKDVADLHGIGPSSMKVFDAELKKLGIWYKE